MVNTEVAAAAAKLAANDHDIVARAAHNLIAKEYRRQKNKEDIAIKTIDLLEQQTAAQRPSQSSASEKEAPPEDVDQDWLNVFEKYAEDASSEKMRILWARILAGEIRAPREFSLKTLRFVSELDPYTAQLFEQYAPLVCNGSFIPSTPHLEGQELTQLLHLQDVGVLTGVGGTLNQKFKIPPSGPTGLLYQNRLVLIKAQPGLEFNVPSIILTNIGKELLTIIEQPFDLVRLRELVERLPKQSFNSVELPAVGGPDGMIIMPGALIWKKPEEPVRTDAAEAVETKGAPLPQ